MSAWQQESEKNSSFLITFRTYTLLRMIAVSYKEKRKKKKQQVVNSLAIQSNRF